MKILFIDSKLGKGVVHAMPCEKQQDDEDDYGEAVEFSQIIMKASQAKPRNGDLLIEKSAPSDGTFGKWEYLLIKQAK